MSEQLFMRRWQKKTMSQLVSGAAVSWWFVQLFISFVWNIWNVNQIVFPIGGVLCGIVSIILSKEKHPR